MQRRTLAQATVLVTSLVFAAASHAQTLSDGKVRIGLILDMSGPLAEFSGVGLATAVKMAVEDVGGKVGGKPIEVLVADHQNRPEVASNKARQWYDSEQVDAILDVSGNAQALAVAAVAKERGRIAIFNSPSTPQLSNQACTPFTIHYSYDSVAQANVMSAALAKANPKTWFFLTSDDRVGTALEKEATDAIKASGGKVLGTAKHPVGVTDFSAQMLTAQLSGAKVIVMANESRDTFNLIKAANEFGLNASGNQLLAGLSLYLNDVHTLGLRNAENLLLGTAFYWDLNEGARIWSRRFFERMNRMPNMAQAGAYSATLHYLKAVATAGTDSATPVIAAMKAAPINDMFARNGIIREDGRMVHDMYLMQVKRPRDSKGSWDYFNLKATVPGDKAFTPLAQSTCPLVKK